ncbi:phosphate-starvation-inducible PsiE family protein [Methyloterricola oryzae]|uniref:phosphate-starvation-inducible PsiE family protein n=1 Tax=Methyloterricola oryzae TaxID=1495050 RepID=UPI0005EAEE7D|nr:phosphate-starvation-inducible PsiE family protein [Methyloterricola oryzae]
MKEGSRPLHVLQVSEDCIYLTASYVLILGAAMLLLEAVTGAVRHILEHDYGGAVIYLLDRVLLAMMVAEIVYTLGNVIRSRQLEAEPFLIVGIIGAVRRMLVVTAESVEHAEIADPRFLAGTTEIGLLTLVILILSISIRVMRGSKSQADATH